MAAIVASKVKRIRKQRDADSQQNLRTAAIGNSQNTTNNRGRGGDSEFENGGGDISPSSILDKRTLIQRQVTRRTLKYGFKTDIFIGKEMHPKNDPSY